MSGTKDKHRSWLPHGFDYTTPEETRTLRRLEARVRRSFEEKGYQEILLPMVDFARTFQETARDPSDSVLFETRDRTGDALAIPSDLTVQVIKGSASGRLGHTFPARFSYIQPVFHDRPWGSGHKREMIQAGVELIGEEHSDEAFQEVLELGRSTLEDLGFQPRILYGDARFLEILFRPIPGDSRRELSLAFHTRDTARIREICKEEKIPGELCQTLQEVPLTFGGAEALTELRKILKEEPELLELLDLAEKRKGVIYDFSQVRELTYYTGPVFEGYVEGENERIFSGGVYDSLFHHFSSERVRRSACGFAINLRALAELTPST